VIIRVRFVVVSQGIYGWFWQQFQGVFGVQGRISGILKQRKDGIRSAYGK